MKYVLFCSFTTGKYAEEFVEKRRERLERWLNRLTRHPLVSKSEVFQHFLCCADNEKVSDQSVALKPVMFCRVKLQAVFSQATMVNS